MSDNRNPLGAALSAIHEHAKNGVETRTQPALAEPAASSQPSRVHRLWSACVRRFDGADSLTQVAVASAVGVLIGVAANVVLHVGITMISPPRR